MSIHKITPFLWFDGQAEQAANHYVSVFPNSRVVKLLRYGEAGPGPKGTVMLVDFELEGQPFAALNGGPQFKFTPAVSFVIHCKTQDEVDHYWSKLADGGMEIECGWLTDKFGLTWQIVPDILLKHLADPDPVKAQRVMKTMMTMKKFDIRRIQEAYEQG